MLLAQNDKIVAKTSDFEAKIEDSQKSFKELIFKGDLKK